MGCEAAITSEHYLYLTTLVPLRGWHQGLRHRAAL